MNIIVRTAGISEIAKFIHTLQLTHFSQHEDTYTYWSLFFQFFLLLLKTDLETSNAMIFVYHSTVPVAPTHKEQSFRAYPEKHVPAPNKEPSNFIGIHASNGSCHKVWILAVKGEMTYTIFKIFQIYQH